MRQLFENLSKLNNAQLSKKTIVYLKSKKQIKNLLELFWLEGFILGFKLLKNNKIKVFLKYKENEPCIKALKFVSKPSCKVYLQTKKLWKFTDPASLQIFSTNKGLKTLTECKKQNLGGELLLIIK